MAKCHKVIIKRSLDNIQATESADRNKVKLSVSSRFYFSEVARSADGAHFSHLFCLFLLYVRRKYGKNVP